MKKGLVASYVSGITDLVHGETYNRIIRYFIPEFITALLLYSLPLLIDAYFVAHLKSTSIYGTLGATNSLIHLILKISEAIPVATVVICGRYNGRGDFPDAGRALRDAFWVTCILGTTVASFLFFGARWIYAWYVPVEMVELGVPFLKLRAVSVLLMFMSLAFIGFLRGIKNTKSPMHMFIAGVIAFLFFDYVLIFGKFGFPKMGLEGSAIASIVQYLVMLSFGVGHIFLDPRYRKYGIKLFSVFSDVSYVKELIFLSLPVMIDKFAMAFSYIWLVKMLKPLGTCGVATFCVIKDMERVALLPAIAFAQVITFLVSNDIGIGNWDGIKSNIKKTLFLSSLLVFVILFFFCCYPSHIIQLFDTQGEFTHMAVRVFPVLSILVFFDVLQIILSGALRGAANVKIVMLARLLICALYFVPVSYGISLIPIADPVVKMVLIYGSFYLGNGLMSYIYINRFRGTEWKTVKNRNSRV